MSDNNMQLPAYMQNQAAQQSNADSMAASSMSIPRISLKGKKFRLIEGGEELAKSDSLRVVILSVEPEAGYMIKTFYAAGYNPTDTAPPDCSSANGKVPDLWVTDKQSDTCQSCPKNAWGSATSTSGKKTKACRDAKRLWVAKDDDIGGTVFGLNVPVTSLKALSEYGQLIKKNQFPLTGVITELTMDEDAEFPQLIFKHVGFLPEAAFNEAVDRSENRNWSGIGSSAVALPAPSEGQSKSANKPNIADTAKQIAESAGTEKGQTIEGTATSSTTEAASVDGKVSDW